MLLKDENHSRDAAMVAYAGELVRRCGGAWNGPEVLALWRGFAWTATGSLIRGFELTLSDILHAEDRLKRAVREATDR